MSVRVSYSGKKLAEIFSQANLEKANYIVANQAMEDMDQFVPYRQGHLGINRLLFMMNHIQKLNSME